MQNKKKFSIFACQLTSFKELKKTKKKMSTLIQKPRSTQSRVEMCSILLEAVRESKVLPTAEKQSLELFILKEMAYAASNGVGKYYTELMPSVPTIGSSL